jgi:hypothetical protein
LTPAEARARLAAEFEKRGWEYDLTTGRSVLGAAEAGESDPSAVARRVPGEFLARNRVTRPEVAAVIERALQGQAVREEERPATIVIEDHSYNVNLAGAQLSHSNVNVGPGTQINVDASARKDDVLAAVAALVAAGLAGDWNGEAARGLATAVDARDDITVAEIQEATTEAVKAQAPRQGRVRELVERVATSGLGGVLATGISVGLGEAISHLPI